MASVINMLLGYKNQTQHAWIRSESGIFHGRWPVGHLPPDNSQVGLTSFWLQLLDC